MAAPTLLNEERVKAYSTAAKDTFARLKKLLDSKQQELIEYDSLIKKLKELPRKRTQPIMCPVGSVGFLSANIIHTNEVLVGLGDGYFVDTTCYDAIEILKRRRKVVEKGIADLHEHENLLENYSKYAKELFEHQRNSDEVEIREEYDEEKESELRKKRRARKAEPHSTIKTIADINAEAELMRRLEELEQQEMRNGELESLLNDTVEVEDGEHSPTLKKILEKLDDDNNKCFMSILSPKAVGGCDKIDQQVHEKKPSTSAPVLMKKEEANINKSVEINEQGASDDSTTPESYTSTARVSQIIELPIKGKAEMELVSTKNSQRSEDDEKGVSTGYFRGDDLMRMLAEQEQEHEENIQAYQPPPGISTEAYQRILRTVEEMDDDDDDDDETSEEDKGNNGRVLRKRNAIDAIGITAARNDGGSDLDSDDLSEPDLSFDNKVSVGPFSVQNLGPSAPLTSTGAIWDMGGRPYEENHPVSGVEQSSTLKAKGSKETKPRKKKSVVFAAKLENATLIDINAPPSDVRTEEYTSSSKSKTTSILRNAGEKTPKDSKLLAQMSAKEELQKVILPGSKAAFTGVVQERNVEVFGTEDVDSGANEESAKPKSLFKMKRLKNHVRSY